MQGTVQNDLMKEYLSRGTYICPPKPSLKMIADVAEYCYTNVPKWNPMNVCSYHLQEAGATPEQELAFALATAIAVLDELRPRVPEEDFPVLVGRISFFVNAGIRFVTEMCKMRAFVDLWDEICETRYGVTDPKYRRFRYGVQVNSLGLTEQQPENNVYRILIEMLAVTLSKKARARAVQLPAWNEALGLPRPWDQQWSMRMQQIMAFETDLLEYGDLFDGNPVVDAKVEELKDGARAELANLDAMGGAIAAIDYMKGRLVEANADRLGGIERGETVVVGVNKYTQSRTLAADGRGWRHHGRRPGGRAGPDRAASGLARLPQRRGGFARRWPSCAKAAQEGRNIHARLHRGGTGGRHDRRMGGRDARGSRRIPWPNRRLQGRIKQDRGPRRYPRGRGRGLRCAGPAAQVPRGQAGSRRPFERPPSRSPFARAICGMDIAYEGIRLTPREIVDAAKAEDAHVVGLSILSGSHVPLVGEVMTLMRAEGLW